MKDFSTIDLAALVTVTGGDGSNPQPSPQPNLTCPAGTSPEYVKIHGQLEGKTPVGVGVSGTGDYESFSCKPLPKQN